MTDDLRHSNLSKLYNVINVKWNDKLVKIMHCKHFSDKSTALNIQRIVNFYY